MFISLKLLHVVRDFFIKRCFLKFSNNILRLYLKKFIRSTCNYEFGAILRSYFGNKSNLTGVFLGGKGGGGALGKTGNKYRCLAA